uniref:Uncharacterized protein n=1 Tax=Rhodnius prolixus TaxID=13249 RepID=T1IF66_RHOPR
MEVCNDNYWVIIWRELVGLHLVPNERRVQQSRQKKKTCNPFFDETFVFQIYARYLLERLANDLPYVEPCHWYNPVKVGYNPKVVHMNGLPFHTRPDNLAPIDTNKPLVKKAKVLENRVYDAIDSGAVWEVVSEKELADHSLTMTVIDSGRNKKNCTIGHVTFPLRHLATEHPTDQLELLKMDLEKECDGPVSDLGELLVSLFYNENLHRLTVSVIAARNLKVCNPPSLVA